MPHLHRSLKPINARQGIKTEKQFSFLPVVEKSLKPINARQGIKTYVQVRDRAGNESL